MRLLALSRGRAEAYLGTESYAMISITDPGKPPAALPIDPRRRGLLRLVFHDVAVWTRRADVQLFRARMAERILRFARRHRKLPLLVVHCEAGSSRAPAVAAALARWTGQDDSHWWAAPGPYASPGRPNRLVYRMLTRLGTQIPWEAPRPALTGPAARTRAESAYLRARHRPRSLDEGALFFRLGRKRWRGSPYVGLP